MFPYNSRLPVPTFNNSNKEEEVVLLTFRLTGSCAGMSSSERVQLMINNVRHKKRDGSLLMMSERIAWCPKGREQFDMAVNYADIKCQKVSPEGKAKIQLQIILLNSDSYVFHFAHSNPATAKSERESIKNLLAQMLPKFRRKLDKELEEKNKLLQTDPELFQTYKDLVVSGVISPEEFWLSHATKLPSSQQAASQNVGVSASFLADVRPRADGCNGLRYNLTSDTIQSIFTTYPAVKKIYLEKVPDKMSEKDFWTKFFQSHYFHRDRINQGNNSDDIFADCVKKDDLDILTLLNIGVKDSFNNLNNFYEQDSTTEEGYGSTVEPTTKGKQSNQHIASKNIIKRFNHQSAMILTDHKKLSGASKLKNGEGETPTKKVKLKEAVTYEDLEESSQSSHTSLKLQKSDRYCHGPTLLNQAHQELDRHRVAEGMSIVTTQCHSYKPRLSNVLNSSDAFSALMELSPDGGSRLSHQSVTSDVHHLLSQLQQDQLKQLYLSATELLRHFWSCFPSTTPFLQEKVVRMWKSIENFHNTRVRPYKDELRRSMVQVNATEHLEEMFNAAFRKYSTWQNKKSGKR